MTVTVLQKMGATPGFRALFETAQFLELPKNRIVIQEGETPGHLFLLLAGRLCVRHPGRHGHELLLAYFYPGDFFGEMCLFPGLETRSALVTSVSACTVLRIPYSDFVALCHRHPEVWLELAGQLAERLRSTNHRLAEMPVLHAADRVWSVIQDMSRRILPMVHGGKIIHITRKDLGRMAGCSRELAGMIVADFVREGRLRIRGRAIIVPNRYLEAA